LDAWIAQSMSVVLSCSYRLVRPTLALLLLLLGATSGCGQKVVFPRLEFKSSEPQTPSIPLSVRLDLPDALKQAQMYYRDSCNVPQAIPLGERLAEQVKADAAQVFEKTFEGTAAKEPADAVLSAVLETSEINLNIPRREIGEYPLKVLIRLRISVSDTEGKSLFNDVIKAEGKWTARTDGTECRVQGIMLPVTEAIEKLSDRVVESLTQAVRIRDAAIRLRTRQELAAGAAAQPRSSAESPTLSFRASLEDENHNQILEGGEKVLIRLEVANSGPGVARGVAAVLSGTAALVKEFTSPTFLGDIQPGEKKQVTISSTLSASLADQQAELVVQITEAGGFGVSTRKRFVAMVQPGVKAAPSESLEVLSVDVDQVPPRPQGFERRTSYAVVIGIGSYRDEGVPRMKFAKRDAEIVGKHLTALAGFPAENVRVLTDDRALLADIESTFEDWLPRKAKSSGIVLVYLVGSGLLNAPNHEMSILAYDTGAPESAPRGYSLTRLQEVLNRIPSRLNLLLADVAFNMVKHTGQAGPAGLPWEAPGLRTKGRNVLIASSPSPGPSLPWEAGQHGLFTYQFLKGIRGQADMNDNGWVDVGELFAYLRAHVASSAAELGKEQVPVILPSLDPDGPIGAFSLTKARRTR